MMDQGILICNPLSVEQERIKTAKNVCVQPEIWAKNV
jgi:hypothetical protein